ncbi:MAG: hypothetical protein Q4C41_04620 [Eggerthellaceae bacterium]|nr:hypothetical protein [Eggerthellaceae bacterium]
MEQHYREKVELLVDKLENSEAIVVGAASGMSAAAGYTHYYVRDENFVKNWGAFEKKYGFHNTFDGFYHHYRSLEEKWGFQAYTMQRIYDEPVGQPYLDLRDMLEGKNFHILTTNQDLQFVKSFPEEKVSQIQGEWRYLQCSHRCLDKLYDATQPVHDMVKAINENLEVPSELVPRCPNCGAPLEPWVRSWTFLEGRRYQAEYHKLNTFLEVNAAKSLLFLELGVGRMTPMFIQEPFWKLTSALPRAYYLSVNPNDAMMPRSLAGKGNIISEDIAKVFADARALMVGAARSGEGVAAGGAASAAGASLTVPESLVPRCPQCGGTMRVRMIGERRFIADKDAARRYRAFVEQWHGRKLAILELGIGWRNQLIKAPLMELVSREDRASYVTVNKGEIYIRDDIRMKSFGLDGDLADILVDLATRVESLAKERSQRA